MKICKKFEFPAIKNWDKYSHLLEKKISWFSLIAMRKGAWSSLVDLDEPLDPYSQSWMIYTASVVHFTYLDLYCA